MKINSRLPETDENSLPRELVELARQIATLPGPPHKDLDLAYDRVVESVKRRRRILTLVQEALSQLRLDVKYLMFDLEVTRRERDQLRELLGDE